MTRAKNEFRNSQRSETRLVIDDYLEQLKRALEVIPAIQAEDIIRELHTYIEDSIGADGDDLETVRAILEDLGDPEEYAGCLADTGYFVTKSNWKFRMKSSGRILGMPYDIGRPTIEKIASRFWNPADPRIFTPKFFGIGWDINFGAIAVKLRLLRPDDEEGLPFSNVPDWALSIGVLMPALLNTLALLVAITFLNKLPAEVPVHYGLAGRPDGFSDPVWATIWWLTPPLSLMVILSYFVFIKRRSRLARAFSVAFLSSISIIGCGSYVNSIYYALNGKLVFSANLPIIAGLTVFFLVLITLSKLGLREEWQKHNVIKTRRTRLKEES